MTGLGGTCSLRWGAVASCKVEQRRWDLLRSGKILLCFIILILIVWFFFLIAEIVCRVNTLCRKFLELNYLVIK